MLYKPTERYFLFTFITKMICSVMSVWFLFFFFHFLFNGLFFVAICTTDGRPTVGRIIYLLCMLHRYKRNKISLTKRRHVTVKRKFKSNLFGSVAHSHQFPFASFRIYARNIFFLSFSLTLYRFSLLVYGERNIWKRKYIFDFLFAFTKPTQFSK